MKYPEKHTHPTDEDTISDEIAKRLLDTDFLQDGERITFENDGGVISSTLELWKLETEPNPDSPFRAE
jgi:hypothetical protein